jgi:hypothetical protein
MKKRRNKKLYTILFILIERGDEEEKKEEFKLLKLFSYVELPYQEKRGKGKERDLSTFQLNKIDEG